MKAKIIYTDESISPEYFFTNITTVLINQVGHHIAYSRAVNVTPSNKTKAKHLRQGTSAVVLLTSHQSQPYCV